mgnify:CR=1 FL=1
MSDRFPRKSRKAVIVQRRKLAVLLAGLLILIALILAGAALIALSALAVVTTVSTTAVALTAGSAVSTVSAGLALRLHIALGLLCESTH